MTDLTNTTPLTIRQPVIPVVKLPKFHVGAFMATVNAAVSKAFSMAYVEPFKASAGSAATLQHPVSVHASAEDLEGRDPSW